MKTTLTALSILASVLAVSSPVLAHHGNAAYDGTVTIVKDATVTKLSWANPHTIIEFDAKGQNSKLKNSGIQNRGGKLVTLAPKDAANAKPEWPMAPYQNRA